MCVICVKVTANDEWGKIKLKLKLNGCLWTVCGWYMIYECLMQVL